MFCGIFLADDIISVNNFPPYQITFSCGRRRSHSWGGVENEKWLGIRGSLQSRGSPSNAVPCTTVFIIPEILGACSARERRSAWSRIRLLLRTDEVFGITWACREHSWFHFVRLPFEEENQAESYIFILKYKEVKIVVVLDTKSVCETLRMADINSIAGIRQRLSVCSLLIRGWKWNTRQTPAILSENPHVRPFFSPCWYKQANNVALTLFFLARTGSQVSRCGL